MKKLVVALLGVVVALVVLVVPASSEGTDVPPTISGSGGVGETVKIADLGSLAGDPGGYTYVWMWDGEQDPGPGDTGSTHTVTQDDVGHELSVLVIPDDPDVERLESNAIRTSAGALVAPSVKVTGAARVKGTLRASFTSPGTAGADVTLSWTRDGVDIPGASAEWYVVSSADAGHEIAFRTMSTRADFSETPRSTQALRIPAVTVKRPTVSGTFRVGRTVKVSSKGTWNGAGYTYATYRWLRNGKPIAGATKSSYRLTAKDRSKRVSLRVTATKKGFPSVYAVSSSKKVKKK